MTVPDLIRFLNAQAQVYSRVIADLTDGRTRTHWIWFILLVESASAEVLEVEDPAHRRPVELPPPFDVLVTTSVRSPRATWSAKLLTTRGGPFVCLIAPCTRP
jgi:hypothetical protein